MSTYSFRHDTSDGSFNLPKKDVTSRTKKKKKSPKKKNSKKLKTRRHDNDSSSKNLFSYAGFANVTKPSEALKKVDNSTHPSTRSSAKNLQIALALLKDRRSQESLNTDPCKFLILKF